MSEIPSREPRVSGDKPVPPASTWLAATQAALGHMGDPTPIAPIGSQAAPIPVRLARRWLAMRSRGCGSRSCRSQRADRLQYLGFVVSSDVVTRVDLIGPRDGGALEQLPFRLRATANAPTNHEGEIIDDPGFMWVQREHDRGHELEPICKKAVGEDNNVPGTRLRRCSRRVK